MIRICSVYTCTQPGADPARLDTSVEGLTIVRLLKRELTPEIDVLSVNEEIYNDQTVKIWAKSDGPFKSYEFSKFWFTPLMGILELATDRHKMAANMENSPFTSYTEIHIFFLFKKSGQGINMVLSKMPNS